MDPRIEELLPFYALDALTDEERELVETYLAKHPEAREQVAELQSATSALPYSVTPVEPSPRTKAALMARVARDERVRSSKREQISRPSGMRWANLFQAFSLGVALIAVAWVIVLNSQLAQLKKEVATMSSALVAQSNSLQEINAKLPKTPIPETITVSLKGTDVQPHAQGQLIADPSSDSAVLVISGLDKLEAGKTYQVWLIDDSGPRSAGLLSVDSKGQAVLILTSDAAISSFKALGISVEPDGGSQQPTGDIVVLSEL